MFTITCCRFLKPSYKLQLFKILFRTDVRDGRAQGTCWCLKCDSCLNTLNKHALTLREVCSVIL